MARKIPRRYIPYCEKLHYVLANRGNTPQRVTIGLLDDNFLRSEYLNYDKIRSMIHGGYKLRTWERINDEEIQMALVRTSELAHPLLDNPTERVTRMHQMLWEL